MNTLLVFSHLRWNFVYQRPQHLLSRLARRFHIVFVEEPVHDEGNPHLELLSPNQRIQIARPHTPLSSAGFADEQLACIEPLVAAHMSAQGIDDYAVWFYTPMALPLLRQLEPRLVIYDCMDELASFLGAPAALIEREAQLLGCADVVLTGGPSLYEAKRGRNGNVLCLPSSVDAAHFAPKTPAPVGEPDVVALQAGIARPRLGFFGVIDERMDLPLIDRLAREEPSWQIVMVGPVVKIDPRQLPRRANLHWLGQQSYEALPRLIADWDLCLMPFAINEATRFISPTKTLEYMAAGKPVVSTAIRDVQTLYGEIVEIADDHERFIDACRRLLAETPAERGRRASDMAVAVSRSSWDRTADAVGSAIDKALGVRAAAPASSRNAADLLAPPQRGRMAALARR